MPDPSRKTISATQVAALFDESPYITRWMLYHWLKGTFDNDIEEDERMSWGKKMQPLILKQASSDLTLEVRPNKKDKYLQLTDTALGCTRDAEIICPDRGPGALEIKCVFDYSVWMQSWGGGQGTPPRIHEIQLQVQMEVGDGFPDGKSYEWGVIAVWLCGKMFYFERKRDVAFVARAHEEAARMFGAVTNEEEPDPFGIPREDPLVAKLWPKTEDKVQHIDDDLALEDDARMFAWARDQMNFHKKVAEGLRPKLLLACTDHKETYMPGIRMKLNKTDKQTRFSVDILDKD